jgi:hypothetical protein
MIDRLSCRPMGTRARRPKAVTAGRRLLVVLGLLALLSLSGCILDAFESGTGPCESGFSVDASAASVVSDPVVGQHVGTLTWTKTEKATQLTFTVGVSGPVTESVPVNCDSTEVTLSQSAQTSDGILPALSPNPGVQFGPTFVCGVDQNGDLVVGDFILQLDIPTLLDAGVERSLGPLDPEEGSWADLTLHHPNGGALQGGDVTIYMAYFLGDGGFAGYGPEKIATVTFP